MAAPTSQRREKFVDHREGPDDEEEKERTSSSYVRRRCCNMKKQHTELIFGEDFQRKTEAKIGTEEDKGREKPDWQIVRRRRRTRSAQGQCTDHVSLRNDDVSSVHLNCCDSLRRNLEEERDRERT